MSHAVDEPLTFCVPTRNRPEFLHRMLTFFRQTDVRQPILIVDSSDASNAARNCSVIDNFGTALHARYVNVDLPIVEKCCEGLARVQTPFVAFCADDDFQFPEVVAECVTFLRKNADYAVAQGRVIHVSNVQSGRGTEFSCQFVRAESIDHSDAAERFVAMASRPFSTFYGVYRTADLRRSFELTKQHTDYQSARVFMESMLIGLSAISGKIKVFPAVQYIQETHGENDSCVLPRVADRRRREALYQRYQLGLAAELAAASGLTEAKAQQLIAEHVGLVPGMRGAPAKAGMAWYHKATRELRRLSVKTTRLLQSLIPRTSALHQGARITLANAEGFPERGAYRIARDLLEKHPMGISDAPIVHQMRRSA